MDELDLVQGLRERREDAVRVYIERYRALFSHCIGNLESDATAREDLFQELAWYALERLEQDRFDPKRGSFGTWLYRVAWCRCVDLKRQQNGRRKIQVRTTRESLPDRPDPHPDPAQELSESELNGLIKSALTRLDPPDRTLLELRVVEERPLLEIAGHLGITLEQTKYRIKRATVELRGALLKLVSKQEVLE